MKRIKKDKKKGKLVLISVVFVLLIFLYYYLVSPLFFLFSAFRSLPEKIKPVKAALVKLDIDLLPVEIEYFKGYMMKVDKSAGKLKIFSFFPLLGPYLSDLKTTTSLSLDILDSSSDLFSSLKLAMPELHYIRWGSQNDLAEGTESTFLTDISLFLSKELPAYKEKLLLINGKINTINPDRYPSEMRIMKKEIKIREYLKEARTLTTVLADSFDEIVKLVDLIPELAGEKEARNYLVFLQNDKEIRPSGGVLAAYALFTVDKGKLIFVKTAGDVFLLDDEIRGYLPAPDFIRQYRGTSRFFLKDASFSPDFKVSAEAISDLWLKIPGHSKVDGVIVLDTHFIASLFEILTSVDVPGYGVFTKDNITEEIQKFFAMAGSRAPKDKKAKDSVSALLYELMNQSLASGTTNRAEVIKIFLRESLDKHLLVYFVNDKMQSLLEKYNFGGRVREYEGDYLYISEANVGGDKSNRHVKEGVKKSVDIKEGKITSSVEITYENIGEFDSVFNRGYQDYVRVYVPRGSKLINSYGSLARVNRGEELGKTFFDGYLRIAPKSKATFTLNYELPNNLITENQYKLLIQKQPGADLVKYFLQVGKNTEEFDLLTDKEIEITL